MANVFHASCYQTVFGVDAKGFAAKYAGRCSSPACPFGGQLKAGEMMTWSRRGAKEVTTTSPVAGVSGAGLAELIATLSSLSIAAIEPRIKLLEQVSLQIDPKVEALRETLADDLQETVIAKVLERVQEEIHIPHRVEVTIASRDETIDVGVQHKQFPTLLKALAAHTNVWLAGPSGSGKTTAAIAAAKALGLEFRYTGAVNDSYALMGYNDVHGKYVRTVFRDAWENGGLFLWDEVDASDPNALLAFNAALANGHAPFPDGVIPKHERCLIVAAANTWGHGATHEYVGRMKLDAAFLKRFSFLSWDYDEDLELATAPNMQWTRRVQSLRAKVLKKGLRVLVTPRESYIGAQLLAAGIPQDEVEKMTVRSGMTDDQWKEISK